MVSLLERERKYLSAVTSLRWILNQRPRLFGYRRGRVWERLAIDLEHLKEFESVIDVCESALCDDITSGGEYLSLQHRLVRVSLSQKKKKKKKVVPKKIEEEDYDSADDFVLTEDNKRRSFCNLTKKKKTKKRRKTINVKNKNKTTSVLSKLTERLQIVRFTIRPLNRRAGEKSRFVSLDGSSTCDSVESVTLQHYAINENFEGLHVEGRLCRALFGLMLWDDVLFRDCENAFLTRHEDFPSDLHGRPGEFVANRQDVLFRKLTQISKMNHEMIVDELSKSWTAHFGQECQGVRWPVSDVTENDDPIACLSVLQCAAVCIGGEALSAIFLRLALNFSHFSGGMPDLFLWRIDMYEKETNSWTPWSGASLKSLLNSSSSLELPINDDIYTKIRFKSAFVEVKGPRDNLSPRQVLWLNILESEAHARAEVCRVDEPSE